MPEIVYRPEVRCEVSEGLTGSDITVCIQDLLGNEQYIHVLPSMVNWEHDVPYLPVGIINVDRPARARPHRTAHRGRFRREPVVDALRAIPDRLGSSCMILSDREMQAALQDGIILIDPRPDESLFTSTALDLTLDAVLLRWNEPGTISRGCKVQA